MLKAILSISFFIFYTVCFSQTDTTIFRYSKSIQSEILKEYLSVLASDSLEGRETGMPGQKMAANYIATKFHEFGLKPINKDTGYFQQYPMMIQTKRKVKLFATSEKKILTSYNDTDYFSFYGLTPQIINAGIVFAGYGIKDTNYNDYENIKTKGKIILLFDGEPFLSDSISPITKLKGKTQWSSQTSYKKREEIARSLGAEALLIIINDFKTQYEKSRYKINHTTIRLLKNDDETVASLEKKIPVVFISRACADWLLGANKSSVAKLEKSLNTKKIKPFFGKRPIRLEVSTVENKMYAENVIGMVEGSEKKDEYIVVSAHYDHLGTSEGKVYNGADDDGSGTVGMMNIARTFAIAKEAGYSPKRSIVFIAFSGEEKGLLGSEYYTSNPIFPLEKTVADLNIDMIGRIDQQHADSADYVYIIGSDKLSSELHSINESNNKKYVGLKLDYTYNKTNDPNRFYYRSDHYNFVKNNIPAIFYFNGTHTDYHKETDEISKINFTQLEKRTKLVFYTAWELANRKDRIIVDVKEDKE